ncbi:MAG: hypothetical protein IPI93_06175 [Sphingobacteriaceae bacterium]|nr:hypothetical protein [Sphingobacteriaceae bacterium]
MKASFRFIVVFMSLSFLSFSQEKLMSTQRHLEELKKKGLQISTGDFNEDVDAVLKKAIDKYWNYCPVKFVSNTKLNKDQLTLLIGNYKIKSWTDYFYTKMTFVNSGWMFFEAHFDNLTAKGVNYGADKGFEQMEFKINIFVLNLAAQFKFHDSVYTKGKKKGLDQWGGYRNKLKESKILIPTDLFNHGVTKESFKDLKSAEFATAEEINKRLADNNTKGYSVLVAYTSPMGRYFNVIDLTSGDYLLFLNLGGRFQDGMTGDPKVIDDKAVKSGIETINESK